MFSTEEALRQVVRQHYARNGYKTAIEQKFPGFLGQADIVARTHRESTFIECKLHLTLNLMAQAAAWKQLSPLVYVAVPWGAGGTSKVRAFVKGILKMHGIGLLYCTTKIVFEVFPPSLEYGHGQGKDRNELPAQAGDRATDKLAPIHQV